MVAVNVPEGASLPGMIDLYFPFQTDLHHVRQYFWHPVYASLPSANRTARQSAASSMAVRPDLNCAPPTSRRELDRRKPGTSRHVTQRREPDAVEILSGVFEGKTTGTPIALLIRNQDQRSKDYGNIADTFRPGHADYTYYAEIRLPRLSRRRPFLGARDGGARGGRGDCPQVAARALRRQHSRLDECARADRDSLRFGRRH